MPRFSTARLMVATAIIVAGLCCLRLLESRAFPIAATPWVWLLGGAIIGSGALLPFRRPWIGLCAGLVVQAAIFAGICYTTSVPGGPRPLSPRMIGHASPKGQICFGIGGGVASCRSVGNTAHIEAGRSKYDVVAEGGKITVNGVDCGTVKGGDEVIGTESALLINGIPAYPKETSNPTP